MSVLLIITSVDGEGWKSKLKNSATSFLQTSESQSPTSQFHISSYPHFQVAFDAHMDILATLAYDRSPPRNKDFIIKRTTTHRFQFETRCATWSAENFLHRFSGCSYRSDTSPTLNGNKGN